MTLSQARHRRKIAAILAVACLTAAACSSGSHSRSVAAPTGTSAPTKVTFWSAWTGRDNDAIRSVADDFERTHPGIKVDVVAGAGGDTTQILPAVAAGTQPDLIGMWDLGGIVKLCTAGQFEHLAPRMASDHISAQDFSPTAQATMTQETHDCGLPGLGDSVGLYYNKPLFAAAGITSPPRTFTEMAADTKKLTQYNPDGSIKVAGFVPYLDNFYANYTTWIGGVIGAQWLDPSGKASIATDPRWAKLFSWQRGLVDSIGADKLTRFAAAAGDAGTAQNAFETGKMAMILDGEWRTAAIAAEHPELSYGTAPFPVLDDQSDRYGASWTTPAFYLIPKGAKHGDAAWQFAKYLSTDVGAEVKLANRLGNIPQLTAALHSPQLNLGPNIAPFRDAFANPNSGHSPDSTVVHYGLPLTAFVEKWQTDGIPVADLQSSLVGVDNQIDMADQGRLITPLSGPGLETRQTSQSPR